MKAARKFISDIAENISIPDIYLDIRQLIEQPDSQISDYVELIEKDSMLTVRIMRIANSEFFGFSRKADNLKQAINLVGVIQIQDLLLSSLCMRSFLSIPQQVLNLKAFWTYSIHCGIAARVIAQHSFAPILNHFFTLGLLHEIGHAAMYSKAPDQCLRALDDSLSQNRPIQELEREYLGYDYCETGSLLMQLWRLPEVYQQVAHYHLEPLQADKDYQYETQVIHLAHTICQNAVIGAHQELISQCVETYPQLARLPASIDRIVINEIDEHTDAVLSMLWPAGSPDFPPDDSISIDE